MTPPRMPKKGVSYCCVEQRAAASGLHSINGICGACTVAQATARVNKGRRTTELPPMQPLCTLCSPLSEAEAIISLGF